MNWRRLYRLAKYDLAIIATTLAAICAVEAANRFL